MCNLCVERLGHRIGWYEIPEDVRKTIGDMYPSLHPIPYVKWAPLYPEPTLHGFRAYEPELNGLCFEVVRRSDLAKERGGDLDLLDIERHTHWVNIVITGDNHWIMRAYLRKTHGFMQEVQELQRTIRELAGPPSYCKVEFDSWMWDYGTVKAYVGGYTEGYGVPAPTFEHKFHDKHTLVSLLEQCKEQALKKHLKDKRDKRNL